MPWISCFDRSFFVLVLFDFFFKVDKMYNQQVFFGKSIVDS